MSIQSINRAFILFSFIFNLVFIESHSFAFNAKKIKKVRVISLTKSKAEFQEDFFEFAGKLFQWTAFLSSKRKNREDNLVKIFRNLSPNDAEKIKNILPFFKSYKDVLVAMGQYGDLNKVRGIEIIPSKLYNFMQRKFALRSLKDPLDTETLLVNIIGGTFDFGKEELYEIQGLIEFIENMEIKNWWPVKRFINNFKDTLTINKRLADQIGYTLLPLTDHYFDYMDTISRLRIYKELATDYKTIDLTSKNKAERLDNITIKIFQTCGPLMIKLLQELQGLVEGKSQMTQVLEGLKEDSKALSVSKAEKLTRYSLRRLTGDRQLKSFTFKKKALGVASIAQTHMFQHRGVGYVVKIQKDNTYEIFDRERTFLKRMVDSESIFNKGMKERIKNTNAGIAEEVDFNFERENMRLGELTYRSEKRRIDTAKTPTHMVQEPGKGDKKVLIMTRAHGEQINDIMKREEPEEIAKVYDGTQRLYYQFLKAALDPSKEANFYHGDLHGDNFFYDLKTDWVTVIDFGNAGAINGFMRKSILNIFKGTQRTQIPDQTSGRDNLIDKAIIDLGSALRTFILRVNIDKVQSSPVAGPLIKTYFRVCFDPAGKLAELKYEAKMIQAKKQQLLNIKKKLDMVREHSPHLFSKSKYDLIVDDIDFMNSLLKNCFGGATNALTPTLNSHMSTSEKLNVVFHELRKNGIAMPKELIFFNKSKGLLEGIMNNLALILDNASFNYDYVDPDVIYHKVLNNIGSKIGVNIEDETPDEMSEYDDFIDKIDDRVTAPSVSESEEVEE